MRFNRKLYKEAFKAGYKRAKFLNEDTNGSKRNKGFFKKLWDVTFEDYDLKIRYLNANERNLGDCDWTFGINFESLELTTKQGNNIVLFEKDIAGAWERNNGIFINFDDNSSVFITFFKRASVKDLDNFDDLKNW